MLAAQRERMHIMATVSNFGRPSQVPLTNEAAVPLSVSSAAQRTDGNTPDIINPTDSFVNAKTGNPLECLSSVFFCQSNVAPLTGSSGNGSLGPALALI